MSNPTTIEAPAGTPFIEVTRDFAATPDLLFRVATDPDLVADWLGPRDHRIEVERYDVQPGGRYRYLHHSDDGEVYAFRGVFHTVEPGKLLIQTWEWEGAPGEVSLEKHHFEPVDGGARLRSVSVFGSVQVRDQLVEYGMESGIHDSMDRLAELVAKAAS